MTRRERWIFAAVFVAAMGVITLAYALTPENLFNSWYMQSDSAIRIVIVP